MSNAFLMTPFLTEEFWDAHVLTGTTAPGSADGIDGNVYLQTGVATGIFIKLAGVWVSVAGLLNVATTAQVNAGVINDSAVTPLGLKNSRYREVYIDDDAPTSTDGVDGDVWLEY